MKNIYATTSVNISKKGVAVSLKSRVVTVTGPRGTLTRSFDHAKVDMRMIGKKSIQIDMWHGKPKENAVLRTIASHIHNMIVGVTEGYRYKMKTVYAHFPINVIISPENKDLLEIRNFLGERIVRRVQMLPGVKIAEVKNNEITLEGNDLELVSRSAALVHQICLVKRKDIRKFLDGIYVSEKGAIKA
nr:60S ribosomal protein L9 [Seculamonas ecuadoriensis]